MHPHKCIHAYNTHTSPHTEMSASHSLQWSDEPIQVLPWSYYTSLLHCTKLTEHTPLLETLPPFPVSTEEALELFQTLMLLSARQRHSLNQLKRQDHQPVLGNPRNGGSQPTLQYQRGKEVFPDPGRNKSERGRKLHFNTHK